MNKDSYTAKELLDWMESVVVEPHSCQINCGSPEAPTCLCDQRMGAIREIVSRHRPESERSSALEDAAKVCEEQANLTVGMYKLIRLDLAKAIRALKASSPATKEPG